MSSISSSRSIMSSPITVCKPHFAGDNNSAHHSVQPPGDRGIHSDDSRRPATARSYPRLFYTTLSGSISPLAAPSTDGRALHEEVDFGVEGFVSYRHLRSVERVLHNGVGISFVYLGEEDPRRSGVGYRGLGGNEGGWISRRGDENELGPYMIGRIGFRPTR